MPKQPKIRSQHSRTPVDRHIGACIRLYRMKKKLSQGELAAALELTFQQVQKYEKGTNRVGPNALLIIAKTLEVPVSALFPPPAQEGTNGHHVDILELIKHPHAFRLMTAFNKIRASSARTSLVEMAEAMATGGV